MLKRIITHIFLALDDIDDVFYRQDDLNVITPSGKTGWPIVKKEWSDKRRAGKKPFT